MADSMHETPSIWTTGWTDTLNTGTWRSNFPVHKKRPAPCHEACPVKGDIPVWIQLLKNEQFYEAWHTLVVHNPFPAITGRICHHPCESKCNRGQYDGAVAVNAIEQYIGDLALTEQWALPVPEQEGHQRVAVIGGGPAGLSCAFQLKLRGFKVTVFDSNAELGGMLRYGIPEYRLPKSVVKGEITRLLAMGIDVQTNTRITPQDLGVLQRDFDAVFVAIGAQLGKVTSQFSQDDSRVITALNFLATVNRGQPPSLGQQVVVIGGGSVAMDAARTARRLGSQVKVLALESRSSLPAQADEVREALEEGVMLFDGAKVKQVSDKAEQLKIECCKVIFTPAAPSGNAEIVVIPNTDFDLHADQVILAIGQDPDLKGWDEILEIENSLLAVRQNYATCRCGVFAGGDVSGMDRFVSAAIGHGKKAADSIAHYLTARCDEEPDATDTGAETSVEYKDINTFYFPTAPRENRAEAPVEERLHSFREVRSGFTGVNTHQQVERCFSCGNCIQCDNCFYFCPDMAVIKDSSQQTHYAVLEQYCKGCGCCVEECPRGAVILKEERR